MLKNRGVPYPKGLKNSLKPLKNRYMSRRRAGAIGIYRGRSGAVGQLSDAVGGGRKRPDRGKCFRAKFKETASNFQKKIKLFAKNGAFFTKFFKNDTKIIFFARRCEGQFKKNQKKCKVFMFFVVKIIYSVQLTRCCA